MCHPRQPTEWNSLWSWRVRFQANTIIDRIAESLFATQVALRRLHRNVPQKELNLLQFAAGLVTETRASPHQVVRG